jgi:hypothetical protein
VLVAESEVYGEHGGSSAVVELGYTAAAAAFAFGPSLGRVVAGRPQGTWFYVRLVGAGIFVAGSLADATGVVKHVSDAPPTGATVGVLIGGSTLLIGTVVEWIATPLDVANANLRIVPVVAPHQAGLAVVGRF